MSPLFSDALLRIQSDERLAALAREGHGRAFGVLVERYRKPLLRYASHIGGSTGADDLLQQSLLRAWSALRGGAEVRHVRAWLHRIVRNTHMSELAGSRRCEPLGEELQAAGSTAALAEAHMELADVVAAISRLPDQQRLAIAEMALGGRSRHEVAEEMGVSEGAVRQLVHRARTTLRHAATIITPVAVAEWAARPRDGSRLAANVTELGGASLAGGGAGLAGGVPTMLSGGAAIKSAAIVVAAAGALGGATVAMTPHRAARAPVVRSSSSRSDSAQTAESLPALLAEQQYPGAAAAGGNVRSSQSWLGVSGARTAARRLIATSPRRPAGQVEATGEALGNAASGTGRPNDAAMPREGGRHRPAAAEAVAGQAVEGGEEAGPEPPSSRSSAAGEGSSGAGSEAEEAPVAGGGAESEGGQETGGEPSPGHAEEAPGASGPGEAEAQEGAHAGSDVRAHADSEAGVDVRAHAEADSQPEGRP